MKALARDRDKRFASAHEMMLALEQALPPEVRAHSEKNTEVFLHRLFAKRIAERNDALKSALLAADGVAAASNLDRPGTAQLRSQSTMRAVSVENGEPRPEVPARQPVVVSLAPRARRSRLALVAVAAGLVGAVGASVLHKAPLPVSTQRAGVDMGASVGSDATPKQVIDKQELPVPAAEQPPALTAISAEASARVEPSASATVPVKKRGTRRAESPAALPEVATPPVPVPAPLNGTSTSDPLDRRKSRALPILLGLPRRATLLLSVHIGASRRLLTTIGRHEDALDHVHVSTVRTRGLDLLAKTRARTQAGIRYGIPRVIQRYLHGIFANKWICRTGWPAT